MHPLARRRLAAALALGTLALGAGCDGEDLVQLLGAGGGGGGSASEPDRDAGVDPSTGPDGVGGGDSAGGADAGGITAVERDVDLLATSALALLTRDCSTCHGDSESAGGVGAVDDVDALVSSGLIIPGDAAASPLLQSIRSGRMPPAGTSSRPSVGEQWLVEGLIESLGPEPEQCTLPPSPSVDDAYAAMLADVMARPEADRRFIRYANLSDAIGVGCGETLQARRWALFEAVNGTSLDPDVHVPMAIDASELIYRLDTRDYDWERLFDLVNNGFDNRTDGWQTIVDAAGDYAVEMRGPEADALRAATGAAAPVLAGGALVWASNRGDVYYALVGARANIFDTQLALGIDWAESMENGVVRRAGFSRPGDGEFIVERNPQAAAERGYWSLLPQERWDSGSIYGDPFDADRVAEQTMWQLPNGLFAYSAAAQDGTRLSAPPDACEDCGEIYPIGGSPAGCHGCHQRGLAPVEDSVLAYVQDNRRQFDPDTYDFVHVIYAAGDLDAQMAADNAIYLDALARAGVPPSLTSSPLSRVFLTFERAPLDLRRAAAELEVTPAALREALPRLPARFAPLGENGGSITRAIMTEDQRIARCVLSEGARNRPVYCPSGS